jgi:hypothetical protein
LCFALSACICYLLNNNTLLLLLLLLMLLLLLLLLLLLPAIDATVSLVLADAMQNFCDSRLYPTARSPIESSRRSAS